MRRLHPLTALSRAASLGLAAGFVATTLLPVVVSQLDTSVTLPAFVGVVAVLLGAGYGYLSYRRFTYELTDDTFDLGKGVLARTEREIPLRRVQNVDVQQSIFQQLFDVAVVRIETAGGGSTEATLSYVAVDEADRLQRGIRDRRAALASDDDTDAGSDRAVDAGAVDAGGSTDANATATDGRADDADAGVPTNATASHGNGPGGGRTPPAPDVGRGDEREVERLVELKFTDLLVLAVTNFKIGSLVFLFFGAPFFADVATDVLLAAAAPFGGPESLDTSQMTPNDYFVLGGVAGPLLAILGYVVSALVAVQEYYGFELGRRGNDLVYERGLLQRYNGSIPTDKIQTLTVTETAPMRWLGYAGLGVETAGYSGGGGEGGSQAAIPLASRARVVSLADELFGYEDVALERPPKRARTRYAFRFSIAVLAVVALAYGVSLLVPSFTLWYVPAVALLGVPPAAHLKWKHRGWALCDDHVVVRSGFWRRRTHVVPYYRLQTIVSEATVFQRRRDLASLIADTASSATIGAASATAHDLDDGTVDDLQRELRDRLQAHLHDSPAE